VIDLKHLDRLDFAGKRVSVIGLGVEGVDLARYLSRRGASVAIADSKSRDKLSAKLRDVEDLPVELHLGSNPVRPAPGSDAIFLSQSVPLDLPSLQAAREQGVPMYSMVQLFLELAPGPVIGITGSSGKTTTTALVAEMLRADERPAFVGGNIGVGLLDQLECLRPYTWSVLEISHTQLQLVDRSPHIAAVLNITPNHLDRFSWDEYRRLKANLVRYQASTDIAVLGYDDPKTRALEPLVRGGLLWFTMSNALPGEEAEGVFVRDGWATGRIDGTQFPIFALESVALRGRHNQENAVAAAAVALASGVPPEAIACAVESFRGVPHRLEWCGEVDGVTYFNDSIATTPERTVAGLQSFEEPVVLLLGGRDKQLPLEELASEVMTRCRAVVLFGESAAKLEAALSSRKNPGGIPVIRLRTLRDAVTRARRLAQRGDVVLLSPACTSYDAYDNFERRGEEFVSLVRQMEQPREGAREGVQPSHP
jgi:UDP-N-acetylmuramoylalanine--D-glutamate ligase